MGNFKKFLQNKNTVTILGVLACLVILYVGYTTRINQKTTLVDVYYAKETIQPKTLITDEMIGRKQVPASYLSNNVYRNYNDIKGKYSNYNSIIAAGSLFYSELLIEEENLPDSMFYDVNEGERVVSFPVTTESTYGNSIMPSNKVDVYVKLIEKDKVIYGQYFEKVEILSVKDSAGNNVFESTEGSRTPSYVYFALEEAKYLLFSSLQYITEYYPQYEIEVVLVPNTVEFKTDEVTATEVTSDYLYDFTLDKIKQIDEQQDLYNELLNEIEQQKLEEELENNEENTEE